MKKNLDDIEKTVANNLKIARKIRGLTLKDLSKILGVTTQQVQKYESGSSKLPIDKLILVAKYLNFNLEFFVKRFEM